MRLKSLNIKGFKSFANQTTIHFSNDVIGIVGPNGSGKSNIVDAIRWVLGEQSSKELRLEAMGDVIFNGTKTKKEGAAATVEFIFENDKGLLPSEYNTVSVSRTLYRSGESEYRLNNIVCRLKDIKSLFIDTGIGSNSYAIIALGMVDDILADKDDARRKMFEQAAGISKYKARKKETLSKLKSTTADLDRIEDLLFEIEGNMKSLEKQAKRTKKYFEVKDEYKALSIQNAILSIQTLKNKYKSTNQAIIDKTDAYQKIMAEINQLEAQLQKTKKANLDKEQSLSQKQRELGQIVSNIRNKESDKSLLNQKVEFKTQNIANIEKLMLELASSKDSLKKELDNIESQMKEEISKGETLAKTKEALQATYQKIKSEQDAVKKEFDEKTIKMNGLNARIHEEEKRIAILDNSVESLLSENKRDEEKLANSASETQVIYDKRKEIESAFQAKNKQAEDLRNQEVDRKTKLLKVEKIREDNQNDLNKINRQIDSKQNEYDLLKSMVESFEGFPESIKFLSTNWRNDVPILTDLLEVEEEFSSVVEQYLEHYLNYYVVNDISEASKAIKLLAGAQKGKANFFLLNKFKEVKNNEGIVIPKARMASEVIKVESKFQNLLDHLLADVYLFDGAMDDFKYDDEYDKYTFLSKYGTFLKTKNTVSGGSVGLFEGKKIGRKKNLEKIEKLLAKLIGQKTGLETKLEVVKKEVHLLKSTDLGKEAEKILREANQINQELIRLNSQIGHIDSVNKERQLRIEKAKLQVVSYQEEMKEAAIRKEKVVKEINALESGHDNSNNELSSINDKMGQASDAFNQSNIAFIRQQNHLENLDKDVKYRKSRLSEISIRVENETLRIEKEKVEYVESLGKITIIEGGLKELYASKSTFQGSLSEAEQEFYKLRNVITEIEEEARLKTRSSNQLQLEINNLKDKFNDLKFSINAVGDRLKIEFDVELNSIINNEPDTTLTLEELEERVEKLRNRINNFGEINPMALEAYEEIKLRYEHIIEQRADIIEARDSLTQTMKEIEESATSQYLESFEKIRENFIMVFRSLFTEDDNCDLILLDPDNPVESKIEIIAKPKGKKPKSLSQLSGGEKTLTATALLFALYLIKPAPFCIFDEVDAPLDDANIQKFNRIIQKFSKDSQFIIVTHNKASMAAVDVLYGVYMIEPGVSGVTPVDFSNIDQDAYFESLN